MLQDVPSTLPSLLHHHLLPPLPWVQRLHLTTQVDAMMTQVGMVLIQAGTVMQADAGGSS